VGECKVLPIEELENKFTLNIESPTPLAPTPDPFSFHLFNPNMTIPDPTILDVTAHIREVKI